VSNRYVPHLELGVGVFIYQYKYLRPCHAWPIHKVLFREVISTLGSHDHYPEFLDVSRVLLILGYLDRLCDPIDVEVETFCRTRDVRRPGPINLSVGVTIKDPGMQ
jgi:hypothetical protein